MRSTNFKLTKFTCFFVFPAIAPVFILPPILFVTFRQMYGISYTQLGTLVLVNFCVQFGVDLIYTFFSKHLDHHKSIRVMPLLTATGLLVYGLIPWLLPQYAYLGLLLGTVIFSASAGLSEVFLSPTLAALPSDNPEREMSMLHSLYGYGSTAVAVVSTVFLQIFGTDKWMYLALLWAVLPLIAFVLFCIAPLPQIITAESPSQSSAKRKQVGLVLCMLCIFLGSAAENTMTNWISAYTETALRIPKLLGDILGLTVFALLMAFTRTAYAKYGKNIFATLLAGMIGAFICYLTAGLVMTPGVCVVACMLTGICTSMLWPGVLILMEEKFPNPGLAAYAMMAAGGDLGASIAPQGLGIVVDNVAVSDWAATMGNALGFSAEQVAMKTGMLTAAVFPLLGIGVLLYLKKFLNTSKRGC